MTEVKDRRHSSGQGAFTGSRKGLQGTWAKLLAVGMQRKVWVQGQLWRKNLQDKMTVPMCGLWQGEAGERIPRFQAQVTRLGVSFMEKGTHPLFPSLLAMHLPLLLCAANSTRSESSLAPKSRLLCGAPACRPGTTWILLSPPPPRTLPTPHSC